MGIFIKRTNSSPTSNDCVCFLSDHTNMGIAGQCGVITTSKTLLVILSSATLSSRRQLEVIGHAMGLNEKGQGPAIVLARVFGFSFPSAHWHDQVLPRIWPEASPGQVQHFRTLFRTISFPYMPHMSDHVVQVQTEAILEHVSLGWQRIVEAAGPSGSSIDDGNTIEV